MSYYLIIKPLVFYFRAGAHHVWCSWQTPMVLTAKHVTKSNLHKT